jgi:hypothetical protein
MSEKLKDANLDLSDRIITDPRGPVFGILINNFYWYQLESLRNVAGSAQNALRGRIALGEKQKTYHLHCKHE